MAKGRLVLDAWKDHEADPFFWILLEGVKEPAKVYYGREGWIIDPHRKETRAKYTLDNYIVDSASKVISSIDIAGPVDEVIKLIEFAGYHGCNAPARPRCLLAPKKSLEEISRYLPTLPLIQELAKNDRSNEYWLSSRTQPLDRPTKYDKGAYRGEWSVVTGRHIIIDTQPLKAAELLA